MRLRVPVAAALTVCPALAISIVLVATETYRMTDPGSPLFGGPFPATLVDAIAQDHRVEMVYPLIRAGADPNMLLVFTDEDVTAGRPVMVSPLLLAVALRNEDVVRMLLAFGAALDRPQNAQAWCLARQMGSASIAGMADAGSSTDERACPLLVRDRGGAPLAWLAQ